MLSEQELLRRNKREELMKLGIDPYPAAEYSVNATAADILKNYENHKLDYERRGPGGAVDELPHHGQRVVCRATGQYRNDSGIFPS